MRVGWVGDVYYIHAIRVRCWIVRENESVQPAARAVGGHARSASYAQPAGLRGVGRVGYVIYDRARLCIYRIRAAVPREDIHAVQRYGTVQFNAGHPFRVSGDGDVVDLQVVVLVQAIMVGIRNADRIILAAGLVGAHDVWVVLIVADRCRKDILGHFGDGHLYQFDGQSVHVPSGVAQNIVQGARLHVHARRDHCVYNLPCGRVCNIHCEHVF